MSFVRTDHPYGGWRPAAKARILDPLCLEIDRRMLLEIGIIVLSIVGFVVLDLYVLGCENV